MKYFINDTKIHFIILNTKSLEFIFRVVILLETSQNMRYFSVIYGNTQSLFYAINSASNSNPKLELVIKVSFQRVEKTLTFYYDSCNSLFTKGGNAGRTTLHINYGFPAGVYLRITRSPRILAKERSILLASMYFPINSLIRSG